MKAVVLLCLLGMVNAVSVSPFPDSVSDCYDEDTFLCFDDSSTYLANIFGFEQPENIWHEQDEFINKCGNHFHPINGFYWYVGKDGALYINKHKSVDNDKKKLDIVAGGRVPDDVIASMLG